MRELGSSVSPSLSSSIMTSSLEPLATYWKLPRPILHPLIWPGHHIAQIPFAFGLMGHPSDLGPIGGGVQEDGAIMLAKRCKLDWRSLDEGPRPRREKHKVSPTWLQFGGKY